MQRVSLANFRESVALLITTMASIYTGLAAVIAFGVVYNSARISLSERARELASLRVLGFTRGEVLRILLLELALLTLIAQPPGWVDGLWPRLDHEDQPGRRTDAGAPGRRELHLCPRQRDRHRRGRLLGARRPRSASTGSTSWPSSRRGTEPCRRIG